MQSGKIKALFIINPILEKKRGKNIAGLISENLDPDRFEYKIVHSEYHGHTLVLARENAGQYNLIVAGGGDGTVNQVANALVHSETLLGILPLGSGKGLARSLGIPMKLKGAIQTLNELNTTRIDTGRVGTYRFFNIAGIGFAAEVAHAFAGTLRRGFFSYVLNIAKIFPGYSCVPVELITEGRRASGKYFDISFANSTQWGYGASISPTSKPDDGLLDICIIRDFPRILVPALLIRLFIKTIHHSRYMENLPVKTAEISGNGSYIGHIDGEPVELTAPFKITIEPGSLNVISAIKQR